MRYLDLQLYRPPEVRHPMEALLSTDHMERSELVTWNLGGEEGIEYALFYIHGSIDAYRDRIEDVDSVADYYLSPVDDGSFYSYVCQETRDVDREFRRAFARRNLVIVPPIRYPGDGTMRLTIVGRPDDLQDLLGDLPEWMTPTVESVGRYDRRHGSVANRLTERQREAVAAAVELGYYAAPREATLEDVADALECTPSTASVHLRKAEARIMDGVIA